MAVALAGLVTALVYSRLRRAVAKAPVARIVAAARDIPAGVALAPSDLRLVDWPANLPLPGSYHKASEIAGRPLIYPLAANEPVLARDLAVAGSGIGLSVKIPPGMRATSVRSSAISGVAGFVYPGSHVDVLATVAGGTGAQTETILQNVAVLTAGEEVEPDPAGKPQKVDVVTLLLNPEDSQKLLLASTQGTIQFVLRNGADQAEAAVAPTQLSQLLGAPAPVAVAARHRAAAVKPPAPAPPYVVELIQGSQRTDQKFEQNGVVH